MKFSVIICLLLVIFIALYFAPLHREGIENAATKPNKLYDGTITRKIDNNDELNKGCPAGTNTMEVLPDGNRVKCTPYPKDNPKYDSTWPKKY